MTLPVIINPLAEEDLADAISWYNQKAGLGDNFLAAVNECIERIGAHPQLYAKIFGEVRRAGVRRFPYGVFYRIDAQQITVVAIYHARRDPKGWQRRASD